MIHIKTQNIPVEVKALPKGKVSTPEKSSESFLEALNTFVAEEQEGAVEVEKDAKDEEETISETIPWFLGQLPFTPETQELKLPVDWESVKDSDEILVDAKQLVASPKMVNTSLDEKLLSADDLIAESVEVFEQSALQTETETHSEAIPFESAEVKQPNIQPAEIINNNHIDNENVVGQSGVSQAIHLDKQTISEEKNGKHDEMVVENIVTEDRSMISENRLEALTVSEDIQMTTLQETIEVSPEDTKNLNDLTETKVAPEVEMNIKDSALKIETDTADKTEPGLQPEVTNIGQFNQIKLMETQLQPEAIKIVPQEQWVEEVESFMVEEVQTSSEMEKVSTARIQLTPKHLGEMDIELTIRDKELTAKLVVEQIETKEWLEQKIAQLTTNLAAQDIQVDDIQIVVAQDQPNLMDSSFEDNPFFKQQKQSFQQKKSFHKGQEEEQTPEKAVRSNRPGNGRLSMWV